MNIYKTFGLREVINANGKMTVLGASSVKDSITENVKNALKNYVVIDELIDFAGEIISKKTSAEDGCPTMGAASGICISVAASITGTNLSLIEKIPNTDGLKNEIIIQKGHNVNFGGNIGQMIALGGGKLVEVGCANKVLKDHIEGAITDKTAALFYVKSHHAVQKGMVSLETMVELSEKYNIPLIADCAAEEDLKKYVSLGVSLILYSGGKALEGPTSGFICGKKSLIEACKMQYKGIGRAMKVSKEAMIGLISALKEYENKENNVEAQKLQMENLVTELNKINGLSCIVAQDEAGREIYRAEIKIDAEVTGISAYELNEKLKSGDPAIFLREYYVNQGILSIDPRPLFEGQEIIIVNKIKEMLGA